MAPERIPLSADKEMHDEPVITTADHLRERQDKSKMPWPESEERDRDREPGQEDQGSRRSTSKNWTTSTPHQSPQATNQEEQEGSGPDPEDVERKAVQKTVRQLREKGVSDEFIKENMDKIRERVRDELL